MELSFLLLIILPLTTAFLIPLLDVIYNKLRKVLVFSAALGEFVISIFILYYWLPDFLSGNLHLEYNLGGWASTIGITLVLDNLSLIFSLLISLSLFLIIIYSAGFIGHHEGKYYVLLFLLLGSMQGTVLTGDIFNLYVFIELITITSAGLVTFQRYLEEAIGGFKYLLYGVIGGLFFLIGIFLIYFNIGNLNLDIIAQNFSQINDYLKITILLLFLTSLLIKLGVFPFHFWLPKAHSICPSSVSALLSGVQVKVFIYVFIRLFLQVFDFSFIQAINLNSFIIGLGLLSSIVAHLMAVQANDVKRMLAFSTIGNLGLILGVIPLNTSLALFAGLLHVISHLLLKITLFTSTGYILQFTEGHHLADFMRVAYQNRGIFMIFTISALGLVGIPPLPGFFSKYYILKAFIEVKYYIPAVLVIISSLISFFYYLRYIFWGYNFNHKKTNKHSEATIVAVFYRKQLVSSVIYSFFALVVLTGFLLLLYQKSLFSQYLNIFGG